MTQLTKRVECLEREKMLCWRESYPDTKTKKVDRNSSLPTDEEKNRPSRTKSLRGQAGELLGHEGNTLKTTSISDKVLKYILGYCSCYGNDLSDLPCEIIGERQVVDLPRVQPEYTAPDLSSQTLNRLIQLHKIK